MPIRSLAHGTWYYERNTGGFLYDPATPGRDLNGDPHMPTSPLPIEVRAAAEREVIQRLVEAAAVSLGPEGAAAAVAARQELNTLRAAFPALQSMVGLLAVRVSEVAMAAGDNPDADRLRQCAELVHRSADAVYAQVSSAAAASASARSAILLAATHQTLDDPENEILRLI